MGVLTPPPERASPQELLALFVDATRDPGRSLAATERCLADEFRFHFTDADRAGHPGIPEFCDQAQLLAATDSMFHHAVHITMNMAVEDTLSIGLCDTTSADSCWVYEVWVGLQVEVPPAPGETESRTYLVYGLSNITASRDADNPEQWVIRDIVDRTNELGAARARRVRQSGPPRPAPSTESSTWGGVLFYFF